MKQYFKIIAYTIFASMSLSSCDALLDVDSQEVVLTEDYLGADKIEARSALLGVLSLMQDLPEQYVVLGEARGDMASVSSLASDEMQQLNSHNISEDNSYVDPATLFSIINNCNYALELLDTVMYENELLENYASMLRIRTWAQFQIVINYGVLPYTDEPIMTIDDLDNTYKLLNREQALVQLIENLLPYADVLNVSSYANSVNFAIYDMIPDHNILLADLYLWAGNYTEAANNYKDFLDLNVDDAGSKFNLTSTYGVTYSGSTVKSNNWLNIFLLTSPASSEVISYIGFSELYRQKNESFFNLSLYIQPSTSLLIDWNSQYKLTEDGDYILGDNRNDVIINGLNQKYSEDYFTWTRAAHIYLRYAEAINYAGYPEHALAVLNTGVFDDLSDTTDTAVRFTGNTEGFLNFDQDKYVTTNDDGAWTGGNKGIRGRVGMAPIVLDIDSAIAVTLTLADSISLVGNFILDESGRETCLEGNRWGDLIRTAIHQNNGSIVGDAIYDKFKTEGNASLADELKIKLSDPSNWYLPLTIPETFITVSDSLVSE